MVLMHALEITEKEFMAQVVELAKALNWTVYHPYDSRRSSYGYPDLTMVRPPRVIFMELKNEKGRLTIPQEWWQDDLKKCPGVEYYERRPSDWNEIVEVMR